MLSWLSNYLKRRRLEESRMIFAYWDGRRDRRIDPMAAWQSLIGDEHYLMERDNPAIERGDLEAQSVAVAAVRKAFAVPTFERGGLTHAECLALLLGFFNYLEDQKKSISDTPISPALTESASSATSTTSVASDCGAMPNEASSASPPA